MDINASSYRILKYLKTRTSNALIAHNEILSHVSHDSRDELNNNISTLSEMYLIDETFSGVSINHKGINYFDKIESDNEEIAYEDVYEDYEYCILKFLFNNNWSPKVEEFPIIIKTQAPNAGMNDDGNLYQYLYNLRSFVDMDNRVSTFKLNDSGRRHYKLKTDRKNKTHQDSATHIGDKIFGNKIDYSVKAETITAPIVTGGVSNSDLKDSFKTGEESLETKELNKKGFEITRKTLIWTILLGGITILISILIAKHLI